MQNTQDSRRFLALLLLAFLAACASLAGEKATATIGIDITPGNRGPVRVALLGSRAVDVKTLDLTTITLAGAPVIVQPNGTLQGRLDDVNHDGITDLVVEIDRARMQLAVGDTTAVLQAQAFDGTIYRGQSEVRSLESDVTVRSHVTVSISDCDFSDFRL